MIKLYKTDKPPILVKNEQAWLDALKQKLSSKIEPTPAERHRYRHTEIKQALVIETSGKCAYCESKILHVTYGDIEHIYPKSKDISMTFKWENLTLACNTCNTNKGSNDFIINPYIVDPEEVFSFVGPMIFAKPHSHIAWLTEKCLDLNRMELIERRAVALKSIKDQIALMNYAQDNTTKDVLREDLLTQAENRDQEYSAFIRKLIITQLGVDKTNYSCS